MRTFARAAVAGIAILGTQMTSPPVSEATAGARPAPIVLFPAYHLTRLLVTVHDQVTDPACPRSGTFEDLAFGPADTTFSQLCRDELLTLRYDGGSSRPMRQRFHEQPGVSVSVADYGSTTSAPGYESMYAALEEAGYTRDHDLRVAGYDSRLAPDQEGFLSRTIELIERTYRDNGGEPVRLVGHSNGPIYAQYLLTHTTQAWRDRHIQGFTPLAGNFPGQGMLYPVLLTGLDMADFTLPRTPEASLASATMLQTAPSTYLSAADPTIIGDREVVVVDRSTGRHYTPADWPALLRDAGLSEAVEIAQHYIGFVRFADPKHFPGVDVDAEKGSGLSTMVGVSFPDLRVGQPKDASMTFLNRDGDGNQEDLTNDAVSVWSAMRCHRFSLTDNPGVDHFALASHPSVLRRLVAAAAR